MLMEPGYDARQEAVFDVHEDPVMGVAVDVLERLSRAGRLTLRAKGLSIPNAVAVANIITENMMKGASEVEEITLDSEEIKELGRISSIIRITLRRV